MKTVIEMALEAGIDAEKDTLCRNEGWIEPLTRFAELVRADERNIVMNEPLTKAQWQRFEDEIRADEREKYKWDIHSCGPTCKRYACVAMREAREASRNATLDEIADKIAAMPFGDTAASFAVWIREQKT